MKPRQRERRTPFVVLGMLAAAPGSGYDLRRRIAESVGMFWQESYGQLYPVLAQLAKQGLVAVRDSTGRGARRRTEYQITKAGRAALAEWLLQPPVKTVERHELLVKVFFAAHGSLDALRSHLDDSHAEAEQRLQTLAVVETKVRKTPCDPLDRALSLLTLRYGALVLAAHRDWCSEALSITERFRKQGRQPRSKA